MDINNHYRNLQLHLDKLPIGFPATKSGVEIKLLQKLFNEEEAQIAQCLSLSGNTAKTVQRRAQKSFGIEKTETEIKSILETLHLKGCISKSANKKEAQYSNAMLAIGMFEFQLGQLSDEFMQLMHQYFDEGFGDEFFKSSLPQLRTSPHLKALVPEYRIDNYDNIRKIVHKTNKSIQVANCVCKEGEALLGNPCKQTKDIEVCIMFDAYSYLERGQARNITKEECLAIIDRAEKEGLVIQPGNSLQPFCICLCCGCCCGVLTSAKKYDKPAELVASNYFAEIDQNLCNGCSICLKRCQMDAISITNKKASIDLDKCIGCGLCVTTCKPKAIQLEAKKKKTVPPMNIAMLYLGILKEKVGKQKMMGNMLKLLMGKPL